MLIKNFLFICFKGKKLIFCPTFRREMIFRRRMKAKYLFWDSFVTNNSDWEFLKNGYKKA